MFASIGTISSSYKQAGTLLLDIYNNAAAGFSLRKLRTDQQYAIRVRRDSDNSEQDIGFTGNDLDTTSLLSFVGAGSGFISIWYDQSRNQLNATQSTTTAQPRIVNSGVTDTLNGKPCAVFDGGDYLIGTTSSRYVDIEGAWSAYAVAKWNDAASRNLWDADDNAAGRLAQFIKSNSGTNAYSSTAFDSVGGAVRDDYVGLTTNQVLLYSKRSSNSVEIFLNNATNGSSATTPPGSTVTPTKVTIGAFNGGSTAFFLGSLQEIVHFGHNNDNNSDITTNINTYYTIF